MNQIEYNTIQDKILYFKKSLHLTKRNIEILNKLDKLMDNEYKYGSSNRDIKKINNYLLTFKM